MIRLTTFVSGLTNVLISDRVYAPYIRNVSKSFFFVIRHSFTIEDLVSAPNLNSISLALYFVAEINYAVVHNNKFADIPCYTCPASMSRHVAGRRDTGSESLWLM